MLEALVGPISLRTVSLSPPSCSSKTSLSLFRPAHLRNEALSIESISTRKNEIAWWSLRAAPGIGGPLKADGTLAKFILPVFWQPAQGAAVSALEDDETARLSGGSAGGLRRLLVLVGPLARPLMDADDDELRGLHRGDPDLADQFPGVARLGRVGLLVALDVVGLVLGGADQGALLPEIAEEHVDRADHLLPQAGLVRLEDHPLRVLLHALAHEDEKPPHVDLHERRIGAERTRAPDADAAAGEGNQGVDPVVKRMIAVAPAQALRHVDEPLQRLVGRRPVDPLDLVVAGDHAGDEP